jgi:hypothetical protein
MKSPILKQISEHIHDNVHADMDGTFGYDEEDIMAAAVLLHAVVMDFSAPYLIEKVGQAEAVQMAREWGADLHAMLLDMTGVDTHDRYGKGQPDEESF